MLKEIWNKWKAIAQKIGDFQANVVFSLLFYLIITPFGIILRLFKKEITTTDFPRWSKWEDSSGNLDKLHQQ